MTPVNSYSLALHLLHVTVCHIKVRHSSFLQQGKLIYWPNVMAFSTKEGLLLLLGFCIVFKGVEGIVNFILKYFTFSENNQADCFQQKRKLPNKKIIRACFGALILSFFSIASCSPSVTLNIWATVH